MYGLDIPIRLETNFIVNSPSQGYNKLLIDTKVRHGNILYIDSSHDLYDSISRLDGIRLSLLDYAEELAYIRSKYPVVVKGKVDEEDWGEILKHFDDNGYQAVKWVKDFVNVSKGL